GLGVGERSGGDGLPGTRSTASVRLGSPDVRGSMSREIIVRLVRRHLAEIRVCYEQALFRQPGIAGSATLQIVIAATGSVISADATDAPELMRPCMSAAASGWTFPSTSGGIVTARLPFTLSPG